MIIPMCQSKKLKGTLNDLIETFIFIYFLFEF